MNVRLQKFNIAYAVREYIKSLPVDTLITSVEVCKKLSENYSDIKQNNISAELGRLAKRNILSRRHIIPKFKDGKTIHDPYHFFEYCILDNDFYLGDKFTHDRHSPKVKETVNRKKIIADNKIDDFPVRLANTDSPVILTTNNDSKDIPTILTKLLDILSDLDEAVKAKPVDLSKVSSEELMKELSQRIK